MDSANKRLKTIIRWAANQERLRTLVVVSPQAQPIYSDHLVSFNLQLFVTDPEWFSHADNWLAQFGPFWLAISLGQSTFQRQTVVYEDGMRMDFTIQPNSNLLTFETEDSFKILIDKDRQAKQVPKSKGLDPPLSPPTRETILSAIDAFWLDTYQAVKFLWRGELWQSKHYDWQMKQDLLQMLAWQAVVCNGQTIFRMDEGERLNKWVDPDTYTSLMTTFGRLYPADSWRALEETVKLFTRLAKQVAIDLAIDYPKQKEQQFTVLVKDLIANPRK